MSKRHYFTSLAIFILATYYVKSILELHWWEAVGLVVMAIVCVVHSIDVMRDVERRKLKKKRHEYGGSERPIQRPQDDIGPKEEET